MLMALVGFVDRLRLKQPTPLGSETNKNHRIVLRLHCYQELNDNDYDEKMSSQTDKHYIQPSEQPLLVNISEFICV